MSEEKQKNDIAKAALAAVVGLAVLGVAVFAAYRFATQQRADVVLPGGTTYLGTSPTLAPQPSTAPLRFTIDPTTAWVERRGFVYPFLFSYPQTLELVVFINDPSDSIGIVWGNIPPQQNLLFNMEKIEDRDPTAARQLKIDFVRNWWKNFSGLKGVASVTQFTNSNGLKGYRASYINYADASPNVDIFFEAPKNPEIMLHFANGILDPAVFDRIIDSVAWTPPSPTPIITEAPTPTTEPTPIEPSPTP